MSARPIPHNFPPTWDPAWPDLVDHFPSVGRLGGHRAGFLCAPSLTGRFVTRTTDWDTSTGETWGWAQLNLQHNNWRPAASISIQGQIIESQRWNLLKVKVADIFLFRRKVIVFCAEMFGRHKTILDCKVLCLSSVKAWLLSNNSNAECVNILTKRRFMLSPHCFFGPDVISKDCQR